ncbi:MAG: alpha/beta fold hydrolase [Anaerolineae bacterium]|nr:alpha/beta fold hydrolase [Anaerolineae bacterium]
MTDLTILYLHGFLSSAQGTKADFLRQRLAAYPHVAFQAVEFNPTPRDFEFMTITGQINRLRQYILERQYEAVSLIGSSLGGQVALHYAYRYGGVNKLLLLAPALFYSVNRYAINELAQWQISGVRTLWHDGLQADLPLRYQYHLDRLQYNQPVHPPVRTLIIHGRNDDVVPITGSRQYASANPDSVTLVEVNSDHRLNDQLSIIGDHTESFLLG